jgi:hypothetical protein
VRRRDWYPWRDARAALRAILGGACALCGAAERLEVDHVAGCTWVQRRLNSRDRWARYWREWLAGVPLRMLCRPCNAARNQWTHGTRLERSKTHAM